MSSSVKPRYVHVKPRATSRCPRVLVSDPSPGMEVEVVGPGFIHKNTAAVWKDKTHLSVPLRIREDTMKPGKNEKRYAIKITGIELDVLHKLTWSMVEAFGLDRRIDAYKGTRAITLYAWDLDCLEAVLSLAIDDPQGHEIDNDDEMEALKRLDLRFRELRADETNIHKPANG